jgi:hypothetical protein
MASGPTEVMSKSRTVPQTGGKTDLDDDAGVEASGLLLAASLAGRRPSTFDSQCDGIRQSPARRLASSFMREYSGRHSREPNSLDIIGANKY